MKVISFEVERLNFVEISVLKFLDERDQEMTKKKIKSFLLVFGFFILNLKKPPKKKKKN